MNWELLWQPAGILIQMIPPAWMGIHIFRGRLRYTYKKTLAVFLAALLVMALVYFAVVSFSYYRADDQIYVTANWTFFLCIATSWLLFAWVIRTIRKQKVFIFMLLLNYSCLILFITNALNESGLFGDYEKGIDMLPYNEPYLVSMIAVGAVAGPIFYYIVGKRSLSGILVLPGRIWYFLLVIQTVYFLSALVILFMSGIILSTPGSMVILSVLFATELVFYGIFFNMLEILDDHLRMELEKKQMENELDLQKLQYERIRESIELTRRARHDLEHHFGVLRMLSQKDENMQKIRDYLDDYLSVREEDVPFDLCRNYVVNAVLNHYAIRAREEGIQMEIHVNLPEKLPFEDTYLSILFGNALKNAIEACVAARDAGGDAWFQIRAGVIQRALAIRIKNSCVNAAKQDENGWLSTKHEGYGVGIASMESVARHYGGSVTITPADGVFAVDILLFMPEEGEKEG